MDTEDRANVLLVDDEPENLLALAVALERLGENLVTATSGREALKRLLEDEYAVVLLAVQMGEMDGFETAALIREREGSQHTPIIFTSATDSPRDSLLRGYALGAADYLVRPIAPEVLLAKVGTFTDLFRLVQRARRLNEILKRRTVELQSANEELRGLSCSTPRGLQAPWPKGEGYGPDDLVRLADVWGRGDLSVDNARLYREAQDAIRARDEFLAVAAHELKTPVTSLKGFAQLTARMIDKGDPPSLSQIREAMGVICEQSDRLSRMMQRLLDVFRIESRSLSLDLKPCDLAAIARETIGRVAAGNDRRPITLCSPDSLPVLADAIRLEQLLTDLLDNALKFSPEGRPIEVELVSPSPDTVRLSVRDHGEGIPPERLEKVFDRFYQGPGDRALSGMGLGLYICKHIVDLHGGTIRVENPRDGGTRFSATLPLLIAADGSKGEAR